MIALTLEEQLYILRTGEKMIETLQITEDDFFIDAILKLGNNKEVMKILEPQIMQPLMLERWMVERTLVIQDLIMEELETHNNQG